MNQRQVNSQQQPQPSVSSNLGKSGRGPVNNGQLTGVNNSAQQFASHTYGVGPNNTQISTNPNIMEALRYKVTGAQGSAGNPQAQPRPPIKPTVGDTNMDNQPMVIGGGGTSGTSSQAPKIEKTIRNFSLFGGSNTPTFTPPPVEETIADTKQVYNSQPNPSFIMPSTVKTPGLQGNFNQGITRRGDLGKNPYGIANDLKGMTGMDFNPGKAENQNQLGTTKKTYKPNDPALQEDLAAINQKLQSSGYPGMATLKKTDKGVKIVVKINPNAQPPGPDLTSSPEGQAQQAAIQQSQEAVNAKNNFIESLFDSNDPNSLGNIIKGYQSDKGEVADSVNESLKQAVPNYAEGSPGAEQEVQRVLGSMAERAMRNISDQFRNDSARTMAAMRKSGFANSTIASQALNAGAGANERRAMVDLEDALISKETEIRNGINDRKTNQIKTLMGYGGPEFPTNVPQTQYADPSLTSRPLSQAEAIQALMGISLGVPKSKNDSYAGYYNTNMQNTVATPGQGGLDAGQIAAMVMSTMAKGG